MFAATSGLPRRAESVSCADTVDHTSNRLSPTVHPYTLPSSPPHPPAAASWTPASAASVFAASCRATAAAANATAARIADAVPNSRAIHPIDQRLDDFIADRIYSSTTRERARASDRTTDNKKLHTHSAPPHARAHECPSMADHTQTHTHTLSTDNARQLSSKISEKNRCCL